jgi:hypothetical protein
MNFKITKIQIKGDPLDDVWKKKSFQNEMSLRVNESFYEAREDLVRDFENHVISKEITSKRGNKSGTLSDYFDYDGYKPNLFGFFGFYEFADPIADISDFLLSNIKILNIRFLKKSSGRTPKVNLTFKTPNIYEFSKVAVGHTDPIVTTNWVKAMETGQKGFQHYKVLPGKGRSGKAVQYEKKLRSGKFKNKKYMSALLNEFKRKVTGRRIL